MANGGDGMSVLEQGPETLVKSYRYLRSAMVGLLLCLAVSVLRQSVQQGSILSSISAYYYTPAQAIFVGVLIAVGVCMIALKGTKQEEDVLLNIGGMLALVVAIVPTGRTEDYKAALAACKNGDGSSFADQALTALDCPSVITLREATVANVNNNMFALMVVGFAGLLATLLFAWRDNNWTGKFWVGFSTACAVYLLGVVAYGVLDEAFIDTAHYPAAIGMFACVVAVVVINALRHQGVSLTEVQGAWNKTMTVVSALVVSRGRYALVALFMIAVVVIGVPLAFLGPFDDIIFWIEAALIVLFAVFWAIQTAERWGYDHAVES